MQVFYGVHLNNGTLRLFIQIIIRLIQFLLVSLQNDEQLNWRFYSQLKK